MDIKRQENDKVIQKNRGMSLETKIESEMEKRWLKRNSFFKWTKVKHDHGRMCASNVSYGIRVACLDVKL